MFAEKTLLILGAGASFKLGLPVGDALKSIIASALFVKSSGPMDFSLEDQTIESALKHLAAHDNPQGLSQAMLINACSQISSAMPLARSIDNFLYSHQESKEIELCGKLGIVKCILNSEANSLLRLENQPFGGSAIDFAKLNVSWHNRFASLLFDSTYEELVERLKKLTVIIFNYDRCFEHFLYHAIKTHYGTSSKEAAYLVNSMAIYHPYGTVGKLPWMGETGPFADYGEAVSGFQLLELVDGIKTYTEGVDRESSEIQEIHEAIRQAKTVVFLGFGFIPLNMQLLRPTVTENTVKNKTVYTTAVGISPLDFGIVQGSISNLLWSTTIRSGVHMSCESLFNDYAFSLFNT
ncbi:hypothetical protein NKH49_05095 [Mesorhizobium sp. M1088]|uniref:hypothetical protein n=1 Tax=Mesorhizobium sp. M1088 TaxID=2957056 RepID=UPI003337B5A3